MELLHLINFVFTIKNKNFRIKEYSGKSSE